MYYGVLLKNWLLNEDRKCILYMETVFANKFPRILLALYTHEYVKGIKILFLGIHRIGSLRVSIHDIPDLCFIH